MIQLRWNVPAAGLWVSLIFFVFFQECISLTPSSVKLKHVKCRSVPVIPFECKVPTKCAKHQYIVGMTRYETKKVWRYEDERKIRVQVGAGEVKVLECCTLADQGVCALEIKGRKLLNHIAPQHDMIYIKKFKYEDYHPYQIPPIVSGDFYTQFLEFVPTSNAFYAWVNTMHFGSTKVMFGKVTKILEVTMLGSRTQGHRCPEGSVVGHINPGTTFLSFIYYLYCYELIVPSQGKKMIGGTPTCDDGHYLREVCIDAVRGSFDLQCEMKCTRCNNGENCSDGKKKSCRAGFFCRGGVEKKCPNGFFSEAKASSCTDCPSGYYCSQSRKMECKAGNYCIGGRSYPCPSRTTSENQATECYATPAGCEIATPKGCTKCFPNSGVLKDGICDCGLRGFRIGLESTCNTCGDDEWTTVSAGQYECRPIVAQIQLTSEGVSTLRMKVPENVVDINDVLLQVQMSNYKIQTINNGDLKANRDGLLATLQQATDNMLTFEWTGINNYGAAQSYKARVFYKEAKNDGRWWTAKRSVACGCDGTAHDVPLKDVADSVSINYNTMEVCPIFKDNSYCDQQYKILRSYTSTTEGFVIIGTMEDDLYTCQKRENKRACVNLISDSLEVGKQIYFKVETERAREITPSIFGITTFDASKSLVFPYKVPWVGVVMVYGEAHTSGTSRFGIKDFVFNVYANNKLVETRTVKSDSDVVNLMINVNPKDTAVIRIDGYKMNNNQKVVLKCKSKTAVVDCASYSVPLKHLATAEFVLVDPSEVSTDRNLGPCPIGGFRNIVNECVSCGNDQWAVEEKGKFQCIGINAAVQPEASSTKLTFMVPKGLIHAGHAQVEAILTPIAPNDALSNKISQVTFVGQTASNGILKLSPTNEGKTITAIWGGLDQQPYKYRLRVYYEDNKSGVFWTTTQGKTCGCDGGINDSPTKSASSDVFVNFDTYDVCPSWKDQSYCDTDYLVSRNLVLAGTPEFQLMGLYKADRDTCNFDVDNSQVCMNLVRNKLTVGDTIEFQIEIERARNVNNLYGQTMFEKKAPLMVSYVVPWIAKITVDAMIDQGGSDMLFPVSDYSVIVKIDGIQYQDEFQVNMHSKVISILDDHTITEMKNVSIIPYKEIDGIIHEFKCFSDSGPINCEDYSLEVKHMSQASFRLLDTSSTRLKGRVGYAGTKVMFLDNCPVQNVTVCMVKLDVENSEKCVITGTDGQYEFVVNKNSRIKIFVKAKVGQQYYITDNNVEDAVYSNSDISVSQLSGYEITTDMIIEGLDFEYTKKATLNIQYYGGHCRLPLEGAKFTITSPFCQQIEHEIDIAPGFTETSIDLPTMPFNISGTSSTDFFGTDPAFKYDIGQFFAQNTLLDASLVDGKERTIKFVYPGKMETVMESREQTCTGMGPLIKTGQRMNLMFYSKLTFPNGQNCYQFQEDTKITIYDRISENGGYCFEEDGKGEANVQQGCPPAYFNHKQGISLIEVTGGKPNFFAPYTKQIEFLMETPMRKFEGINFDVVVHGEWSNTDEVNSFGLPQSKPFTILRNPPGDKSYAVLEAGNTFVLTTNNPAVLENSVKNKENHLSQTDHKSDKTMLSNKRSYSRSKFQFQKQSKEEKMKDSSIQNNRDKMMRKTEQNKLKSAGLGSMEIRNDISGRQSFTTKSFTTTKSYKTSDYAGLAGANGDLFVVPNIRIMTYELLNLHVYTSYHDELNVKCDLYVDRKFDFGLKPMAEESDAVSVVTQYDIESNFIPQLRSVADATTNNEMKLQVEKAIAGWNNLILMNEELKILSKSAALPIANMGLANGGDINRVAFSGGGHEFKMSRTSTANFKSANDASSTFRLMLEMNIIDGQRYNELTQSTKVEYNSKPVYLPTNSAGFNCQCYLDRHPELKRKHGSSCTSEDTKLKVKRHWMNVGKRAKQNGGCQASNRKSFNDMSSSSFSNDRLHVSFTNQNSIVTSFSLSDSNLGDQFDVRIYEDPVFKTPVYETVAGTSKCPHEAGTVAREKISMRGGEHFRHIYQNVLDEQTLVIPVELMNENPTESNLVKLSVNVTSNSHNLGLFVNGISLAEGVEINIPPFTKVPINVNVKRGSGFYSFKDVEIMVGSKCEIDMALGRGLFRDPLVQSLRFTVKYLQPCTGILLMDELGRDKKLKISHSSDRGIPVVIRTASGEKMGEDQRLDTITLEMRRKGSSTWTIAETFNSQNVNGKGLGYFYSRAQDHETQVDHSYSSVTLDADSIMYDGVYELRVHSKCEVSSHFIGMDDYYSDTITAIVDRKPPLLMGREPRNGMYEMETLFGLEFDEYLDCKMPFNYHASLDVLVDGADHKFNYNNEDTSNNTLWTTCENNNVLFEFAPMVNYEKILGHKALLKVCGLSDLIGNKHSECIEQEFDLLLPDPNFVYTPIFINVSSTFEIDYGLKQKLIQMIEIKTSLPSGSVRVQLITDEPDIAMIEEMKEKNKMNKRRDADIEFSSLDSIDMENAIDSTEIKAKDDMNNTTEMPNMEPLRRKLLKVVFKSTPDEVEKIKTIIVGLNFDDIQSHYFRNFDFIDNRTIVVNAPNMTDELPGLLPDTEPISQNSSNRSDMATPESDGLSHILQIVTYALGAIVVVLVLVVLILVSVFFKSKAPSKSPPRTAENSNLTDDRRSSFVNFFVGKNRGALTV